MSAPREVTPAEALPFTLVKRTQAPGQECCQGQQVARGNDSWGTKLSWSALGWEGIKQQNWEEWPDPQPLAISSGRQQSKPPLTLQEFSLPFYTFA